jgi:2-oxoglutarate dehydrogenase E2 component (dihydrolipoamide succinyltransferase)
MAKVDVIMPQMGESIAEGTLTRWMKGVGDAVDRDEDLFEISTDKVDADIPSPAAGVLAEILVQEGETVEVNTIVARIETEVGAVAEPAAPAPAQEEPRVEAPATVAAAEPAAPAAAAPVEPAGIATEPDAAEPQPSTAGAATRDERLSTRSTPLVRKIAAEHGVDITQIQGSGISGRVTRDDILSYLESGGGAAPTAEPEPVVAAAPAPTAAPSPTPPTTAAPATAVVPPAAPVEMGAPGFMQVPIHGATLDIRIPPVVVRENDRVEEMNRVRLRTMEHMLMSQSISAHVTSVTEIDFERVVRLRRKLKSKYAEQGVKLTYGPFIMKAVIEALLEYPILNASVDGTRVVYHGDINLGIAVAVNDGKELIVPVLKNADRLSLMGLAEGANVLAEKARTKTLDLSDAIGIRHMSYFGLSYDHRVVDGAVAAFWLNKVQEVLENFPEDSI